MDTDGQDTVYAEMDGKFLIVMKYLVGKPFTTRNGRSTLFRCCVTQMDSVNEGPGSFERIFGRKERSEKKTFVAHFERHKKFHDVKS